MKWYYPILAAPVYLLLLMPLPLLYVLSDGIYLLLFYVVKYRRKVVDTNLLNAFPEKTAEERKRISIAYYRYMVDVMIETLKGATISSREIQRRVKFSNPELALELMKAKRSYLFVMGHFGNWEWCGHAFCIYNLGPLASLYHPLSNAFFNWFVNKIRTRFGLGLIPMNNVLRELAGNRNQFTITAFIADQTPLPENAHWVKFLNQDTPVFVGTEKIARRFNYPVVFASCVREARGRYRIDLRMLCEEPAKTHEGWLTELHTAELEKAIQSLPHTWLWSHRRWKHKRT